LSATLICVGLATLDRVWRVARLPVPGEKVRARAYLEVGGGQAANAAVTAARLGGDVALWGMVGADGAGRTILDQLRSERVDAAGMTEVAGARTVTAAVLVDASGERSIIADFDPKLHAAPPRLDLAAVGRARAVLADVKWKQGALPVLAEARRCGVPTILDIEPAPAGGLDELCRLADHAIFGQPGLAAFTGVAEPHDGLRRAREKLSGVVGVTLGARGILLLAGGDRPEPIPAPKVDVVDTTGAGDAFHGAYALAIAEGQDAAQAARFANAVAAMKCTEPGGRAGLPTRAEVARFMERHR
jgi:sulfofructose kinase